MKTELDILSEMIQKDKEEGLVVTDFAEIRELTRSLPPLKDYEDEDE